MNRFTCVIDGAECDIVCEKEIRQNEPVRYFGYVFTPDPEPFEFKLSRDGRIIPYISDQVRPEVWKAILDSEKQKAT